MGILEIGIIVLLVAAIGAAALFVLSRKSGTPAPPPVALPTAPKEKTHWLIAEEGPLAGQALHIGTRVVTIGRGVSNFIQVNDDKVSRQHAQFSVNPSGEFQVTDLTSRNGTTVNGSEFDGQRILLDGDTIDVGRSRFTYRASGEFKDDALRQRKDADTRVRAATEQLDKDALADELQKQANLRNY